MVRREGEEEEQEGLLTGLSDSRGLPLVRLPDSGTTGTGVSDGTPEAGGGALLVESLAAAAVGSFTLTTTEGSESVFRRLDASSSWGESSLCVRLLAETAAASL